MGYRLKSYVKEKPDDTYVVDVYGVRFDRAADQHIAVMLEHQVNDMMLRFEKMHGSAFEVSECALQDNAGNVYTILVRTEEMLARIREASNAPVEKVYADDAWFVMFDAESEDGDPRGTYQDFVGRTLDPAKAFKFLRDSTDNPYWCGHVEVITDTESVHVSTIHGWDREVVPALKFKTEKESA